MAHVGSVKGENKPGKVVGDGPGLDRTHGIQLTDQMILHVIRSAQSAPIIFPR